jgi:predicted phosphoribosyltransferase
MLPYAGVSQRERDRIVADVLAEVRRRSVAYVGHDRPPNVRGRRVYMVDDGLASGYTMIAAAQMVRRQEPAQLFLAVPVSPVGSLRAAEPYFDDVTCLIAQATHPFAVASFYADFHDMSDDEVREVLRRTGRVDS